MRLFDIQTAYLNRLSSLRLYFNLYIIIAKLLKLDLESPETNKHLLLAFIIKKICYSTDSSCYLILKMFINWFDKCVNRMSCYLCGFCYYWLLKWFAEWFYICKLYSVYQWLYLLASPPVQKYKNIPKFLVSRDQPLAGSSPPRHFEKALGTGLSRIMLVYN